jgi:hypothetical protein
VNIHNIPKDYDPANPYEWYDAAIKGARGPIHVEEPQTGWYRNRRLVSAKGETPKRYEWDAVCFWRDTHTGEQRCHVNGKQPSGERMIQIWTYANQYPISEETYDAYLATGKWPEHNDVLADQERRSNAAPDDDSLEGVQARIDALVTEANRLLKKGAAKTQAEADSAADVAVKLGELYTHADNLRKKEKQPHLDAERAVDAAWNPVRDSALVYKDLKSKVVQPYLDAEDLRRRKEAADAAEAQRKAQAEAQQKARIEQERLNEQFAREAAAAAAAGTEAPPPPEDVEVELPPEALAPIPEYTPVRAGTGKRVSSRKVKSARIDNYAKALEHFAEHEDVKALVQKLADKLAAANMPVPGCTILTNGKAV